MSDVLHTVLNSVKVLTLPTEQAASVQQILFRGVMTPTLTPVRPGLHRQMLDFSECHCRNNMVDRITATRSTSCPSFTNATSLLSGRGSWCLAPLGRHSCVCERLRRIEQLQKKPEEEVGRKIPRRPNSIFLHHADETPYEFVDPQGWKNSLLINASRCKIREVNFTGDSGNKGMRRSIRMPTLNPKHRPSN